MPNRQLVPLKTDVHSLGFILNTMFADGRDLFADFMKCEFSEENILFWRACEDLKWETHPEKIEKKAQIIYENFIAPCSKNEVSG